MGAVNVWKSYETYGSHMPTENSGDYEPLLVIKRNNSKPLVIVDAEYL